MVLVRAKTWLSSVVSRNWQSVPMACCQHTIQQRPPERISPLMGWTAASRCQLQSWQRTACEEKGKRGPPTDLWERMRWHHEPWGVPKHVSGWHQCENVLASAAFSPLPPQLTHKHTVALLWTHGTSTAASGRADSWQLRFVFASWESWHCHFINYLWLLQSKRSERWIILRLQLQTWLSSKRFTINIWHTSHPHNNAGLTVRLLFRAKGLVCPRGRAKDEGFKARTLYVCCIYITHSEFRKRRNKPRATVSSLKTSMLFGPSALHEAVSAHLFMLESGIEKSSQKASKDYASLSFS